MSGSTVHVPAGSQAGAESAWTLRPLARPNPLLGKIGGEPPVALESCALRADPLALGLPPSSGWTDELSLGGLCVGNEEGEMGCFTGDDRCQGLGAASQSQRSNCCCVPTQKLEHLIPSSLADKLRRLWIIVRSLS